MPTPSLEIDRNKFERLVENNASSVAQIVEKLGKGELHEDNWIFTLDQVLAICDRAAIGIYWNSRRLSNPKSINARDTMRKQVNQIIRDAFTRKTMDKKGRTIPKK